MSGQMTVNRFASSGATRCHIACVCGLPCSISSGGPEPPWRRRIVPPGTFTCSRVKPSKNTSEDIGGLLPFVDFDVGPAGNAAPAWTGEGGAHDRQGGVAVAVLSKQGEDHTLVKSG